MGLAILFRRSPKYSPFRSAAIDLIKYRATDSEESLLIGTGYLDSGIIMGSTKVGEPSKDDLINAICSGYFDHENIHFVAGGYDDTDDTGKHLHTKDAKICKNNSPDWINTSNIKKCYSCEFEYFIKNLKDKIQGKLPPGKHRQINIHHYKCQEKTKIRWHAKIIMKIKNGKPYAFIIGSSNLTNVAFGYGSTWTQTNFECDVVVYPNEYRDMFDKSKYPSGTFLPTRSMNLLEVENLSKTFVKEFLDSKLIDGDIAKTIFDNNYLSEVKNIEYSSNFIEESQLPTDEKDE